MTISTTPPKLKHHPKSAWVLTIPLWYRNLSLQQRRFWWLFFSILILAYSPVKSVGQGLGILTILGLIAYVQLKSQMHVARYLLFAAVYLALGSMYALLMPQFSFTNFFLFALTISGGLIFLYDFRPLANTKMLIAIGRSIRYILVTQGIYGIIQGTVAFLRFGSLDSAIGDFVRGTIEPGFGPTSTGSNQMFAILTSVLLLFYAIIVISQKERMRVIDVFTFGAGALAWLFASVMHSILTFVIAVSITGLFLWRPPSIRRLSIKRTSLILLVILTGFMLVVGAYLIVFTPRNIATLPHFINVSLRSQQGSYKTIATRSTISELPKRIPIQPLLGVGLGQYSSRAALIRTGEYLSGSSVPLPDYTSTVTEEFILNLWRTFFLRYPNGGSTYFPFYSWMSLYGEAGLVGVFLLVIFVGQAIIKCRRSTLNSQNYYFSIGSLILILYVLLLGFQDNYWEFTQIMTPTFLMIKLGYCLGTSRDNK